jgi:hypothetical protein
MKVVAAKKTSGLFTLLGAILISMASLAFDARAQEKKTVRVVFVSHTWTSSLPFRIAMARGYFKNQGLTVEPIFIRGGPTAIAALISGDVDFASIGGAQSAFRSRARGLEISIIGSISNRVNYVILGNKSTKTIEDLKGKIIGVTGAGAFSDFAIRTFFKNRNIDPDRDVHSAGDRTDAGARCGTRERFDRRCAVFARRRGAAAEQRLPVDCKSKRHADDTSGGHRHAQRDFGEVPGNHKEISQGSYHGHAARAQ